MAKKSERKKKNFMINYEILQDIEKFVPNGKVSDFVNHALEEAISKLKRKIASENMNQRMNKINLKISTKKLIQLKNEGRM